MNPKLEEVNDLYMQIQNYIDPAVEYLTALEPEKLLELQSNPDEKSRVYEVARRKFLECAPVLSPDEVIEGYRQGCRLLQRNLSGHMCHSFDQAYIPIMIDAVQNEQSHTAYLFLQSLADNLGKEIAPIVIKALDSESGLTRETALAIVRQLELVESTVKVRAMTNDTNSEISYFAKEILRSWEAKTE